MAKLGFFWYSKIDIFACTIRKGWSCFDWYLEASKTENDTVTCLQKINKKLLETIRTKKAASTDFARLQVWLNWEVTFGIYAIWFLPFGALLPLGFWFLGISLPSVSFGVWLLAGEVLVWFGLLVWFECTDIWYNLFELMCELLTLRFHTQPGNPLGKFFKWLVNL